MSEPAAVSCLERVCTARLTISLRAFLGALELATLHSSLVRNRPYNDQIAELSIWKTARPGCRTSTCRRITPPSIDKSHVLAASRVVRPTSWRHWASPRAPQSSPTSPCSGGWPCPTKTAEEQSKASKTSVKTDAQPAAMESYDIITTKPFLFRPFPRGSGIDLRWLFKGTFFKRS